MKQTVNKQPQLLRSQGIIEPPKNLQFYSPLLVVKHNVKKSQRHEKQGANPAARICCNLRYLNSQCEYVKHEKASLTAILDVLPEANGYFYSVMDLKHL